jgi:hypothetical protein
MDNRMASEAARILKNYLWPPPRGNETRCREFWRVIFALKDGHNVTLLVTIQRPLPRPKIYRPNAV